MLIGSDTCKHEGLGLIQELYHVHFPIQHVFFSTNYQLWIPIIFFRIRGEYECVIVTLNQDFFNKQHRSVSINQFFNI